MEKFSCTQHGCEIEADEHPATCPVCENPQNIAVEGIANGNGDPEWSDLTKDELVAQLEAWKITEGWNSRSTKDELIECLEVAELEAEESGDDKDD